MFRPVGSITDYKYSKALSNYKKIELGRNEWFFNKTAKWIKGNKWVLLE